MGWKRQQNSGEGFRAELGRRWGSRGDAGGGSEGEGVGFTVNLDGKGSYRCGDARGTRMKMTMEYRRRDFDT